MEVAIKEGFTLGISLGFSGMFIFAWLFFLSLLFFEWLNEGFRLLLDLFVWPHVEPLLVRLKAKKDAKKAARKEEGGEE